MSDPRSRKIILESACKHLGLEINLDDEKQLDPILFSKRADRGATLITVLAYSSQFDLLIFLHNQYQDKLETLLFPNPGSETEIEMSHLHTTYNIFKRQLRMTKLAEEKEIWKSYIRLFEKQLKPLDVSMKLHKEYSTEFEYFLEFIFGKKTDYTPLEIAVAKIKTLFTHPEQFILYLQFLEREFNRYNTKTSGKPFPTLSPDKFSFVMVDGYEFPIPTVLFKDGLSKLSAFQEFLMLFLRQAGWATSDQATQWMGYVPNEKADALLLANGGAFVTEGRMKEGLFHGKLSHMVQLALLVIAMQDNWITGVTLQEIVDFAIHQSSHARPSAKIWSEIFDAVQSSYIDISDPYRLHSLIMRDAGKAVGTPSMASYMIDTFCKGFNRAVKFAFQKNDATTEKAFLEGLRYSSIFGFIHDKQLLSQYVAVKKEKHHKEIKSGYAIFEKKYKPNKQFKPMRYQLFTADRPRAIETKEAKASPSLKQ